VACLALVAYGAAHPSRWVWSLPQWNPSPPPLPTLAAPSLPEVGQVEPQGVSPVWESILATLGIALAVGIALALASWLIRLLRALARQRLARWPDPDQVPVGATVAARLSTEQVADAVAEALRRLDQAGDPTDAVISAWLAFEEAAARHGVERGPAQTPTEFTMAVLARSQVPLGAVSRLRALYWGARFSAAAPSPAQVGQARAALAQIAGSWQAAP
jgi:hypothetical protein